MKRFKGSPAYLIFWVLVFFPFAVVYWAAKQEVIKE